MDIVTEVASSPVVAIPLGLGTIGANLVTILPIVINLLMACYLLVLLGHKLWVWYKEIKGTQVEDEMETE